MLRDTIGECKPKSNPLERPDYTEADAQAARAVHAGTATADQQMRFIEYLLRSNGKDDQSFRPGDPYVTAFASGLRQAALDLVWILRVAPTRTDPDKIAARNVENG